MEPRCAPLGQLAYTPAGGEADEGPVRSWVFRHRHRLLALLGKPAPAPRPAAPAEPAPAPRVVTLVPARRGTSR